MEDNIIKVDSREMYMNDMGRYSIYILYNRYVPDIRDGLKPGQRRILYVMQHEVKCISNSTKRKSSNTVGIVIAKYHSHGDTSVYDTMKPMTNWFEIKVPLIVYASNSGSIQGADQAAMRYTESYLSQFALDHVIGELAETQSVVDWQKTFDNNTIEPQSLPVMVPLLLINGTFGIAIGRRIEVPHHSLNDVIDATLTLLHNPKASIVLIPDPCMPCELVDTDWKSICDNGYGSYTCRGIVETIKNKDDTYTLSIRSTPDLVFSDTVKDKIEDLVRTGKLIQIKDIQDHSTNDQLQLDIHLKKGSDPNYVKQMLYKNTPLQVKERVNMEVLNGLDICRISYKAYILYFLEYRRLTKFRLYNYRLQKVKTRYHQIDTYIKILKSGDVENIIHMIRNQKSMDENYLIDWLIKKLDITDLQAKFILHTEIVKLSKGNLKKYEEEYNKLEGLINNYIKYIVDDKLIDQEIEQELLYIKEKYGKPRQSIIISESEADDIPSGEFKIVITESGMIKKMQVNDPIKSFRGDNAKFITIADNSKDILLFDQMGNVFRLQTHKIPFSEKNSPGTDIRLLIKKLTSNIINVLYVPDLELLSKKRNTFFIISVTNGGMIKRMSIDDIINATPSGIIYSKLNDGDKVSTVTIANNKSDVVVFTKSKALRININSVPYLKRSTLGNQVMKTAESIDGLSIVDVKTTDVIVITTKGKFNRFSISALPLSDRNKAGSKVIKLSKGDSISNIITANTNTRIMVTTTEGVSEICVKDIPIGSSVSSGTKLFKDIIHTEVIY